MECWCCKRNETAGGETGLCEWCYMLPQAERLLRVEIATLTTERDDWRDRCTEAQAERDAAREERDELKQRLDAVEEAIEADARVETTALVQAVRAIAEGREP